MPIPTPRPKEKQTDYISRCHKFLHDENKTRKPKRSSEQISAICFGIWRKKDYSETKEIIEWYESKFKKGVPKKDGSGKGVQANKGRGGCPSWVQTARKLLASKRGNPKLREYWKKRLDKYKGEEK